MGGTQNFLDGGGQALMGGDYPFMGGGPPPSPPFLAALVIMIPPLTVSSVSARLVQCTSLPKECGQFVKNWEKRKFLIHTWWCYCHNNEIYGVSKILSVLFSISVQFVQLKFFLVLIKPPVKNWFLNYHGCIKFTESITKVRYSKVICWCPTQLC